MKSGSLRSDPVKVREWQRRSRHAIPRNVRLALVTKNKATAAARYERQFGDKAAWIRKMPCAVCGASGPSDPHHVETCGAGHGNESLAPFCRTCHDLFHTAGRWTFRRITGVNPVAVARRLHGEWLALPEEARRAEIDP